GRPIDGADDLDGLAAFATVDQGRRADIDGLEEIGKLVAMADVGDPARFSGARLESGAARHGGEDLVVAGDLLLELPERDVILLDAGRAAVAVDLGPLEQPR